MMDCKIFIFFVTISKNFKFIKKNKYSSTTTLILIIVGIVLLLCAIVVVVLLLYTRDRDQTLGTFVFLSIKMILF